VRISVKQAQRKATITNTLALLEESPEEETHEFLDALPQEER